MYRFSDPVGGLVSLGGMMPVFSEKLGSQDGSWGEIGDGCHRRCIDFIDFLAGIVYTYRI